MLVIHLSSGVSVLVKNPTERLIHRLITAVEGGQDYRFHRIEVGTHCDGLYIKGFNYRGQETTEIAVIPRHVVAIHVDAPTSEEESQPCTPANSQGNDL